MSRSTEVGLTDVSSPAMEKPKDRTANFLSVGALLRNRWLIALVLGSHLPFFLLHLCNLGRHRPHYEFFPLVLVASAWLMYRRWPRRAACHTRVTRIAGTLLLGMGCGFLAAAVLMFSPWLAAVVTLLSLGGTLLRLEGNSVWRERGCCWGKQRQMRRNK